jgi:site-specific recombinase XerC
MKQDANIPLVQQLIGILAANREDAYRTHQMRGQILKSMARDLHAKFGLQKWDNLKQKHVAYLVDKLKAADKGSRTIDGKLSNLRWLCRKIGKANLMPKTNKELGIASHARHTHAGRVVTPQKLQQVLDALKDQPRLVAMVLLARALGLRFREAALFEVAKCWRGNLVVIFRGAKGGRDRYLHISSPRQVEALKAAQTVAPNGPLIPDGFATFEQFRQWAYKQLRDAGLSVKDGNTFHDLRRYVRQPARAGGRAAQGDPGAAGPLEHPRDDAVRTPRHDRHAGRG